MVLNGLKARSWKIREREESGRLALFLLGTWGEAEVGADQPKLPLIGSRGNRGAEMRNRLEEEA